MARRPSDLLYTLTRDIARDIETDVAKDISAALKTYVKSRGSPRKVLAPALSELNLAAAQGAQRAMLQAYKDRPLTLSRLTESYRVGAPPPGRENNRYAGGQLLRALSSDDHVVTSSVSSGFFDAAMMDREAPQWYRMSFGAGASSPSNIIEPMKNPLNNRKIVRTGILSEYGPSAAFNLPGSGTGRWFVKNAIGGYGEIHVSNKNRGIPPLLGLSIQPARFVQAGIEEMNRIYPRGLVTLVIDFLEPARQGTVKRQLKKNAV